MEFLRLLESIRTPALDTFFSAVTYFGDELLFMALAMLIFWCVDKRTGYYAFLVGLFGTLANQFLKILCRIPRPWVLDPDFTIVESARAAATGYSFPSGHTQNAVGTFGVLAVTTHRKWVRAVCIALIVLVPFSRMYLGVHTPLDVGVAFLLAAILVAAFYPAFRTQDAMKRSMPYLRYAAGIGAALFVIYVTNLQESGAALDQANLDSAVKNAWTLLGTIAGLFLVYDIDRCYIRFDTRAPLPGQICKLVLGLPLAVAIKTLLKAPRRAILDAGPADAIRYLVLVLFVGCIWPLTFPFFARLGRKKEDA